MSDDISKVVREMRRRACGCYTITPTEVKGWASRMESSITPAAINPASVDNQFTYSPIEPPYRLTPAITTDGHAGVALDPEGSYTYYNDYTALARQLAEANSELEMHRVDATRVAACPWRIQKGHTSECQPPKRLQDALDQLAEATRRLGEMEEALRQISSDNHAGLRVQQIAQAALTKEPTK